MLFSIVGIVLMAVGWWGIRRGVQAGVISTWDAKNIERRERTMRRGSYACLVIGALFVILAVASAFAPPPPR